MVNVETINGVYYLIKRSILRNKTLKDIKEFKNLIIDGEFAIDIDDIYDFLSVEAILENMGTLK